MTGPPPVPAPRVSVVVPTFHRPELLARCLEALLRQTLPADAYEIVVVDDGHTREAEALVSALGGVSTLPAVRYLRPANGRGPSVARNCGWRAAAAPLVAFTDDDTIPAADWLAAGERALREADGEVAAVCGRVEVPPPPERAAVPGRAPTDHERMTRGLETAEFVTANAFVRRAALEACGGFDERFARAWREDSDLHFTLLERRAGVGRAADAVVVHPVRHEAWGVSLRQQKNVFYDALLYKKHPRLYRERILAAPPWNYYAIVVGAVAAVAFGVAGHRRAALACAAVALALVAEFAWRRLRLSSRTPGHVAEMLATSPLIPFLSVYWRLRGALHFRVAYW